MAPAARAPVLYPAPQPSSRRARTRLLAKDGALVLSAPQGDRTLATTGAVVSARLVGAPTEEPQAGLAELDCPCLLLIRRESGPIALPLVDWLPQRLVQPVAGERTEDLLALGGMRALLAGLGREDAWTFDVDSARVAGSSAAEVGRAQVVAVRDERPPALRRVVLLGRIVGITATAAFVANGIVHVLQGEPRPDVPLPPVLLLLVATAALLGWTWWSTRSEAAGGAAVEAVALADGSVLGRGETGDLVLTDRAGRIGWLPGPAAGGVLTVMALMGGGPVPLLLLLGSAGGTVLAEVPGSALDATTTTALRGLCERAGLGWQERRSPRLAPVVQSIPVLPDEAGALALEAYFVVAVLAAAGLLVSAGNGFVVAGGLALGLLVGALVLRRVSSSRAAA